MIHYFMQKIKILNVFNVLLLALSTFFAFRLLKDGVNTVNDYVLLVVYLLVVAASIISFLYHLKSNK